MSVNRGSIYVPSLTVGAGFTGAIGFLDLLTNFDIYEELCLFGIICEQWEMISRKRKFLFTNTCKYRNNGNNKTNETWHDVNT